MLPHLDTYLGKRLLEVVEKLGFDSHADFLKKVGINKVTFYSIVRNNRMPQRKTLRKLQDIGINTKWLITGEGEPLLASEPKQEIEYQKPQAAGERLSDQEGQTSPSQDIEKLKNYLGQPMREKPVPVSPSSREDVFGTVVKVLLSMSGEDLEQISKLIALMIRDNQQRQAQREQRENH